MNRHVLIAIAGLSSLMLSSRAAAGGGSLYELQIDALDPQACGGQGCWTNHMRVTDLDGDGSLDILLANYNDFFGGGDDPEPLVIYTNDGDGGFTNVSASALGNYAGNHHQVAVGDVDGDGARDIFGPDGSGGAYVLFINDGTGNFVDEADARLPGAPYPQGGAARMGDVDADGDLDIFSSDGYGADGPPWGHLYVNDGTGVFTEQDGAIPDSINGGDIDDLEFFDADGDHDLDLVVNAHSGGTGALWLNDGAGMFSASTTIDPPGIGSQFHYNVAPCDVDGDRDLDLWIDNTGGNYTEQLLINDGVGNFADETAARVTGGVNGSDDNGVVCTDVDDDGDFDAVVIALGSPERFYENDGSGNFSLVGGVFPGPTDCSLWGEFGDLNGDGRIDLVTGQGECSSSDEVYFANDGVPVDSRDPVIRSVEAPPAAVSADTEVVVRYAVSDRTVTDEGPRLARAYAVLDPSGAATEIDATAMGGDLFRVTIPAQPTGTVVYTLCAEDPSGNVGCSTEQMYDVSEGGTTTGGSDSGGADTTASTDPTDPDSSGGASASASASASNTGTASDSATASAGDSDGSGSSSSDTAGGTDTGGCSCDMAQPGTPAWFGLALLGVAAVRRRRRR